MNIKLNRMTKRAKGYVWLKWNAYGCYSPRGTSHRMTEEHFKENYMEVEKGLYARKSQQNITYSRAQKQVGTI